MKKKHIANTLKSRQIFKNKGWEISLEEDKRFLELLKILNDQQQDLMIELLKRFDFIKSHKVLYKRIIETFKKVNETQNIYVYPLKEAEVSGGKSSDIIHRTIRLLNDASLIPGKKIIIFNKMSDFQNYRSGMIFLVDDYIGSGMTASDSINGFLLSIREYNRNIKKNNLSVFALVGSEIGIFNLGLEGIHTCVGEIHKRGISDYYIGQEQKDKVNIMKQIENIMNGEGKLKKDFNFGFGQIESLVSFDRCSNTVFPAFRFKELYKSGEKRPNTFIR